MAIASMNGLHQFVGNVPACGRSCAEPALLPDGRLLDAFPDARR